MKLSELIPLLQRIQDDQNRFRHGEDLEVVIVTSGIGGSCVPVTFAYSGIDWYSGRLCLRGERTLSEINPKNHSFFVKQYLYKHSNLRKLEENRQLTEAKYKKKTAILTRNVEAILWISEQLKNDQKLDDLC